MFFVLMFMDVMFIILNTWYFIGSRLSRPRDFLRRNFATKVVVMVKLTAREIIAAAESERPQRSTPYFSVSQQRIVRRSDQGMASQWSQNRSFVHIILQ